MKVSIWILMGVILMAASVHAVGVDGDAARCSTAQDVQSCLRGRSVCLDAIVHFHGPLLASAMSNRMWQHGSYRTAW
ncbi:MAG: hypothetical protein COS85_08310 [Armatimonadetes bacterium CG07_land_8_20_14_0_80_59_28]|nr:MAG: hypothetical protein COS85_08310 [Armatimonadetes bacterium CG07_land_8_20_14_0_80_59_28]